MIHRCLHLKFNLCFKHCFIFFFLDIWLVIFFSFVTWNNKCVHYIWVPQISFLFCWLFILVSGFIMSHLCLSSFLPFPAVFYLRLSSLPAPSLCCFNFSPITSSGSSVNSTSPSVFKHSGLHCSTLAPSFILYDFPPLFSQFLCVFFLHHFMSCASQFNLTYRSKSSLHILSLKSSLLSSLCLGPPLKPVWHVHVPFSFFLKVHKYCFN